jgi:hypothetical protein
MEKTIIQMIVVALMDMCTQLKDQRKASAYTSRQRERGSANKTQQHLHVVIFFECILFLVNIIVNPTVFSCDKFFINTYILDLFKDASCQT